MVIAGLARLIVVENGKALPDARAEVAYVAEFLRWYAEEALSRTVTAGMAGALPEACASPVAMLCRVCPM
ncbi:hypothetical protein [Micromonospora fulviviridis]|uniref:hypothetical protein n=1 Tax=Micromonospora fulviviridis TaxID=47860 RepID=UPI00378FEC00